MNRDMPFYMFCRMLYYLDDKDLAKMFSDYDKELKKGSQNDI